MRILCFGDSNTYGYDPRSYFGSRYPREDRWVDLLAEKTGWEAVNAGESGREIPRREGEFHRCAQLLAERQPDLLLVMLGGNDLLQGADASETANRMERFLAQIPMKKERILLICPPPMKTGAWVTGEQLLNDSAGLASVYEALSKRLGVRFADAGKWGVELTFDGVHFSVQGQRTFAEKLRSVLCDANA